MAQGYRLVSTDYWKQKRALSHITPGADRWPEGEDFPNWLAGALPGIVLEFGCGTGRLARGFSPNRYIGVDVSPHALELAVAAAPDYDFRLIAEHDVLPKADAAFAHTVLLHVPDLDLPAVVSRLAVAAPRVLVSEIMGRRWRRTGNPPVYNREPEAYVEAFAGADMTRGRRWVRPYHRYGGVELTALEFVR